MWLVGPCCALKETAIKDYILITIRFLKTVDIGAYPTFHIKASWVKKMIVKQNGFLLVYGQKTVHCDNREEMKKKHPSRLQRA